MRLDQMCTYPLEEAHIDTQVEMFSFACVRMYKNTTCFTAKGDFLSGFEIL